MVQWWLQLDLCWGFLMVAFSVLSVKFKSYSRNHVFVLFPSPPEPKALHFLPPQAGLAVPSLPIACPEAKGNTNFLAPQPSLKQCCHARLTLLLSALNWLQALLGVCVVVTPAWHQEPNHTLLAPPELDFKRSLVSSHDAGSDLGRDGCVYVGFRTLIVHFTRSSLYSLLWFKRIMSNMKSPQLSRR